MFFNTRLEKKIERLENHISNLEDKIRDLEYATGIGYSHACNEPTRLGSGSYNYTSTKVNTVVVAILDHLGLVYRKDEPKTGLMEKEKKA